LAEYIDISLAVSTSLPVWPGSPAIEFQRRLDLDRGDPVNDTTISFSVHTGTHVDAPRHFIAKGNAVETLPLETLIGPVIVIDLSDLEAITADDLESLALQPDTQRLLIRTNNSQHWISDRQEFAPDFVALTADAAQWIVDHNIRLVGIDYLSIQRFYDGPETHLTLLEAGVIILEGLNLSHVLAGQYELLCLPLKLVGAEGAPARAVLKVIQ